MGNTCAMMIFLRGFLVTLFLMTSAYGGLIHRTGSSFNGGRSQINLNFVGFAGEFGFLNVMKTAQQWNWVDNTAGGPGPDMLDINGYPIFQATYLGNSCGAGGVCHSGLKTVTQIPPCATRSCSYVLITTGTGTVFISGLGSQSVSGANTQTSFTATPSLSNGTWQITVEITATDVATPVISLAVVHVDDTVGPDLTNFTTKSGTALGVFGTQFLARLKQLTPGVIRFLNWQGPAYSSNVAHWSDRTPVNYIFYNGYTYNSAYYAAATNSGNDYSISLGVGAAVDKQVVHVLFQGTAPATNATVTTTNTNCTIAWPSHGLSLNNPVGFVGPVATPFYVGGNYFVTNVVDANNIQIAATVGGACIAATQSSASVVMIRQPTLNLNATTAIPIKNMFSNTENSDGNNEVPTNGRIGTLVYDADLGSWMLWGGSSGDGLFNQGITNGVPIELCVMLASYIGAHPWFVQPFLTAAPAVGTMYSDWLTSLASYIKNNGPSWMIPRFEGVGNEVWNSQFYGTSYANNKASIYWGTPTAPNLNDYNNFYGYAASLSGQATNTIYGGGVPRDGSRYQIIVGVQQVSSPASNDARLASTKFLSTGPTPPSGFATSAAYNWVTHEAPANYYGPGPGTAALVSAVYQYGTGDTSQIPIYVAYAATANPPAFGPVPTKVASFLDHYNWGQGNSPYNGKPWASAGVKIRQTAYEGGWSPGFPTSSDISTSAGSNSNSPVTSVSKAANAVIAMTSTTNPNSSGPTIGNGAVVGMPIRIVNAAGGDFAKLNSVRTTITFTNGVADINLMANGFIIGQSVAFTTASTSDVLPSNLSKTVVYCVVAAATNTFQVSTTCGGGAITINTTGASGTQQVTAGWYVTGVAGGLGANNVSINADTSAYTGSYTASSATLVYMSDNYNTRNIMIASLSDSTMGALVAGSGSAFFNQLAANGCEFPSQFDMAGLNYPWTPLSPDIFVTPDPSYWTAMSAYNH